MIEQFLDYMDDIKGRSPGTIEGYRNDLDIFFDFLKSRFKCKEVTENTIKKITLKDLHAYISYLTKTRHNDIKSKARKIACLKSFFRYLRLMNIIEANPAVDLESPKLPERQPVYLKLEEANELLTAVDGANKERDNAIITLFLNCGLRLSELVSIDIDDVKGDILSVIGKGNKERTIYLNDICKAAIKEYLQVRPESKDKALFLSNRNMRIGKRGIQHMLDKFLNKAALTGYSPHKLRHTAATLLYQHGNVDIRTLQEILGHKSVSTTQIYTHINNEQLRNAVNKNPLNKKGENNG